MSTQDDVAGATFSVQYRALVANVVTPKVVAIYRPIPVG